MDEARNFIDGDAVEAVLDMAREDAERVWRELRDMYGVAAAGDADAVPAMPECFASTDKMLKYIEEVSRCH